MPGPRSRGGVAAIVPAAMRLKHLPATPCCSTVQLALPPASACDKRHTSCNDWFKGRWSDELDFAIPEYEWQVMHHSGCLPDPSS